MSATDQGRPVAKPKPKVVKRSSPPPKSEVAATSGYKRPAPPRKTVVRRTTAPRTDVQSSGPDYGAKKATAYKSRADTTRAVSAGKKMVAVGTVHLALNHDEPVADALSYVTDTIGNIAQRLRDIGRPPDAGRMDRQGVAEVKKGATYVGDTGRNILRRLQHTPGGVQQASVLPIGRNDPVSRAAQNLPADVANTFVNAIPATAHVASELAHGQVGKAGKQLAQPYVDIVKHPGRSLIEHPFSTAALVTGPLRGASRAAGAVARRGVLGDAAKAAASTDRAPATVTGTKLVQPRRYSPDPVGKAVQVLNEKGKGFARGPRKAVKLTKKADKLSAQGQHAEAAALRDEAARHSPTRMHEDQVKKRVDVIRDVNEVVRRGHAKQVSAEVHAAVRNKPSSTSRITLRRHPDAIKPTAAVSLVAQKIVHPTVADLQSYLTETERAYHSGDLTPAQRAANEELRNQITDALAHPQDMRLVQQAADRYRAVVQPLTKALERHRMLDPTETAKRVELPFAVRKLGAVRDAKPRLTEAGTSTLVMKAKRGEVAGRVVKAQTEVQRTRVQLERAVADARVAQQRTGSVSEARTPQGNLSVADRLRNAMDAHDQAKAVLAAEKARAIGLREDSKTLRKAVQGKPLKKAPGFVDEQGRPFTGAQMRAERIGGATDAATGAVTRAPLPGDAAYVSHAPNITRPGSFYKDSGRPVSVGNRAFTGGSVTKGTHDASEHAMHASARKLQSLLDAHEGHLAFLDETALRNQKGDVIHGDRTRVQAAIDKMTLDSRGHPLPGARRWRIVRTNPFGGRGSQLDELIKNLNDHGETHSNTPGGHNPVVGAIEDALAGRGDGPFVAIPEEAAVRLEAHLKTLGNQTGHVWNVINTLWRKNVLAFSAKWAASNVGEATERSLVAGVRPGDRALLLRTVNEWKKTDPAAAERFMASVGGGHYGFVARNQRYATSTEFADPTRNGAFIRTAARIAGTIERTPVINWLPKVYGAWTGHVMNEMGRIESQFRMGMAGKKLRDLTQQNREFADLSEKGLAQALKGLTGTPTQIEIANFARKAYGQYEAFSPKERAWIATYTPFMAWAKNAARFVLVTLPKDHPVVTAMAADLSRSQEPWLRSLGLWIGQPDSLPSYLMGDVPTPGGGLLKVAKYTPQSLLADPVGTLAGLVLPSGQNILMAAKGLDPFGNPLRESKQSAMLKGLLGLVVPGPLAPRPAGSQSSLVDTLNPVQVIPGDKVRYARVKASLDRLNQKIVAMPPADRAKQSNGKYKPAYQKVLDERTALTRQRHVLLVKAGYVKDPTLAVDQQIRQAEARAKAMRAKPNGTPGAAGDEYQYYTPEYLALEAHIRHLTAERQHLLKTHPRRVVRLKQPPETGAQQTSRQIQRQLYRLNHPDLEAKAAQDQLNRQLERLKQIEAGG